MIPPRALALLAPVFAAAACGGCDEEPEVREPGFRVETAVSGLGQATDLAFLPDGRMVVTEKTGEVKLVGGGQVRPIGAFAVDADDEKGLLGVAVDPDFGATRRLFFYYSLADAAGGTDADRHRVVSVRLGGDDAIDAASETVLVKDLLGPANHDGGALAIGPDGLLYVGVGDAGVGEAGACGSGRPPEPPTEPSNYFPTCLSNANGKILRIGLAGEIPADNPLAAAAEATACGAACSDVPSGLAPPRREIWAWGFRNPWRFAFDPETGLLWVGDVGEVTWEEVTIVEKGRHHGWPWREGRHGWPRERCREISPDAGDCVEPVFECGRADGCVSITGGVFLAGPRWPEPLRSRYVFADAVSRVVRTVELTPDRRGVSPGTLRDLATSDGLPVSIRVGPDGDVYVAVLPGQILRISPAP